MLKLEQNDFAGIFKSIRQFNIKNGQKDRPEMKKCPAFKPLIEQLR